MYVAAFLCLTVVVGLLSFHGAIASAMPASTLGGPQAIKGLFANVKRLWLFVGAKGHLADTEPVTARVKLNPVLPSTGITARLD